jgi:hypothetical protein
MNKLIIVLMLLASGFISGCSGSVVSNHNESAQLPLVEAKDKHEWKKVNELRDNEGNKVCAYKIAGDVEWWDIIIVYDKDDTIKQVISKQFRN